MHEMLALTNLGLFVLHFASASYVFINRDDVPDRFRKIKIFRQQVKPAGQGSMEYGFSNELVMTVDLVLLIASFFLITSLFHLAYFLGRDSWYNGFLNKGWNPVRWIEYSVTATIMVVILALTATVQDASTLLMLVCTTAMIMLLGGCIERAILSGDKLQSFALLKIGWILQLAVFFVIGLAFVTTIRAVNDKLAAEQAKEVIPDWVYAILVAELVFFSCFGFVSIAQFVRKFVQRKETSFVSYEKTYHLLSLLAKLTLGWVFFIGATKSANAKK